MSRVFDQRTRLPKSNPRFNEWRAGDPEWEKIGIYWVPQGFSWKPEGMGFTTVITDDGPGGNRTTWRIYDIDGWQRAVIHQTDEQSQYGMPTGRTQVSFYKPGSGPKYGSDWFDFVTEKVEFTS